MIDKPIDYKATRKRVIKHIDRYDRATLRVETKKQPTITQSYDVSIPGGSGFNSKTENAGIYAAEGESEDLAYMNNFAECLSRLKPELREIFVRMYLKEQTHKEMMKILSLGNTKLSSLKREATESFAIAIDCVVYEPVKVGRVANK